MTSKCPLSFWIVILWQLANHLLCYVLKRYNEINNVKVKITSIHASSLMNIAHQTKLGTYYIGDSNTLSNSPTGENLRGKVQLIFTSPPFPLNNKKSYGNLTGEEYKNWFSSLAPIFADLLTPDGSIVIELGNAWEPGRPIQSLLHLESLIAFVNHPEANLRLCQQFICYNPTRLPSPAQWVTITRQRVTDSYTHVWWMAKTDTPKADNIKVLRPYSQSMQNLFKRRKYNAGKRPSEHNISLHSFLNNNEVVLLITFLRLNQSTNIALFAFRMLLAFQIPNPMITTSVPVGNVVFALIQLACLWVLYFFYPVLNRPWRSYFGSLCRK